MSTGRLFPADVERGGELWLVLMTAGFTAQWPPVRTGQDLAMMGDERVWLFDWVARGYCHSLGLSFTFNLGDSSRDYVVIDSMVITPNGSHRQSTSRHARNWEEAMQAIHWLREDAANYVAKRTEISARLGARN